MNSREGRSVLGEGFFCYKNRNNGLLFLPKERKFTEPWGCLNALLGLCVEEEMLQLWGARGLTGHQPIGSSWGCMCTGCRRTSAQRQEGASAVGVTCSKGSRHLWNSHRAPHSWEHRGSGFRGKALWPKSQGVQAYES